MENKDLLVEINEGIAVVSFNRPKVLNALIIRFTYQVLQLHVCPIPLRSVVAGYSAPKV